MAEAALPENRTTPVFTLNDTEGTKRALADYRGQSVVVFFACGCRWCHDFGKQWAELQREGVLTDVVTAQGKGAAPGKQTTLLVFMGDAAATTTYAKTAGFDLKQTVLLPDPNLKITQLYHAMPCPRLYVLDGNGLLRYVNNHSDDQPQKAAASVLVAKTVSGMRRSLLPPAPAPPVKNSKESPKKPAPKSDGGGNGKA